MSDWLDELSPDERKRWDEFVDHARREAFEKIDESAFVMSLVPKEDYDVKFAVELGAAIMLDKPILAVLMPGGKASQKLLQVADEVVYADVDVEEGQRKVAEAIDRMMRETP